MSNPTGKNQYSAGGRKSKAVRTSSGSNPRAAKVGRGGRGASVDKAFPGAQSGVHGRATGAGRHTPSGGRTVARATVRKGGRGVSVDKKYSGVRSGVSGRTGRALRKRGRNNAYGL